MSHGKFPNYPIGQFPFYAHETEYLTGSPTYTDDLARKTEFMRYLGHRVWEYDKEMAIRLAAWDKNLEDFPEDVKKLLQQWMDDGTLDEIINEHIFSMKADKTWVQQVMGDLRDQINADLDKLKEGFVYVMDYGAKGDGVTNDAPAIQAALNVASGKTVVFPDRTFRIGNILRVKSDTTVVMQPGTILRRGADITSFFINDSDGTKGGYTANKNIHFSGGTIDINKNEFPTKCTSFGFGHCENVSVTDMQFINMWQWHYVEFSGCKNTLVARCTFDGHTQDTASEHVQFDVHKGDTTFPWFGPYDGTPCIFGTVRDSLFKNGRRGVGTHSYVEGNVHQHILIENNRFENMRDFGINTYDYQDSIIRGNTFIGGADAIYVLTSVKGATKNILIEGNYIKNMTMNDDSRGIRLDENAVNVSVKNNVIDNCSWHGIFLNRTDFGEVSGNIVTGCKRSGIYFYSSYNLSVHSNTAHGNATDSGYYDLHCGQDIGTTASCTDHLITTNNVGSLGLRRTLNCGVFHNHVDSYAIGDTSTDLLMKDNCVNGVWV